MPTCAVAPCHMKNPPSYALQSTIARDYIKCFKYVQSYTVSKHAVGFSIQVRQQFLAENQNKATRPKCDYLKICVTCF